MSALGRQQPCRCYSETGVTAARVAGRRPLREQQRRARVLDVKVRSDDHRVKPAGKLRRELGLRCVLRNASDRTLVAADVDLDRYCFARVTICVGLTNRNAISSHTSVVTMYTTAIASIDCPGRTPAANTA